MRTLYAMSANKNLFSCLLLFPRPVKLVSTLQMCRKSFSRLLTYKQFLDDFPRNMIRCQSLVAVSSERYLCDVLSARLYHRSARCTASKVLTKPSKRNDRYRNMQSTERLTYTLQMRKVKLREARRKMAKKMEELKENVITIPNALCLLRMGATPVLGYFVLQEYYAASLGIFILAGCTDMVDGYIARTFPGQKSMIGSFLDPAADKLLVATLFITLTANGLIPVPLTSMIILRDVCLFASGFYIRYVSLPPPKTLSRYFDVSFATASLRPTVISKLNTMVQLSLIGCSLAAPVFGYMDHFILPVLWYVTGATTVLSAASYLFCKNTYKLLNHKHVKE